MGDQQHSSDLNERIQRAQKLETLEAMWSGIAHDFNNLLMGIMGNADMLIDELPVFSSMRGVLDDIILCANRASDLCRQMMAYAGKPTGVKPVDINDTLTGMTSLARALVERNVNLKTHLGENLPKIEADATQLSQIIMNLLINAADEIGRQRGNIEISTGTLRCDDAYLQETFMDGDLPSGEYVYVEIVHSMAGEEKESAESEQGLSNREMDSGRDLGMAVVLAIVRAHRGALKIIHGPGPGSGYRLLFPALQARAAAGEQKQQACPWQGEGIILLVDDEETILNVGERMLNKLGFTVMTANSGREALDIFREGPSEAACVMLDVAMSDMDGVETFRAMKRLNPDVRAVLMSGYSEHQIRDQIPEGIAGFIQKPFRTENLRTVLKTALSTS